MDNESYLYHSLGEFDRAMIGLINAQTDFNSQHIEKIWDMEGDQLVAYRRGDLLFVFNFNGRKSFTDYGILTEPGEYKVVLNTDNPAFGGFGLVDESVSHLTIHDKFAPAGREWLKLYIPARSAQVLQKL